MILEKSSQSGDENSITELVAEVMKHISELDAEVMKYNLRTWC
jgi:hypothetical protein